MSGFSVRAFNPTGPTVDISGATVAPSGLQVKSVGAGPAEQYRVFNSGSVTVHVAFGVDAATAQTNAAIPTAGVPKNSIPIPALGVEVISALEDCFWSAITGSSTAEVYITPGKGL